MILCHKFLLWLLEFAKVSLWIHQHASPQTSGESLLFWGCHVPEPLTKSLVSTFKTIGGVGWRWIIWVNLTKFNVIWGYTNFCQIMYQNQEIFSSWCCVYTGFKIRLQFHTCQKFSFWSIFGMWGFFAFSVCQPLRDSWRDSIKKAKNSRRKHSRFFEWVSGDQLGPHH